MTSKEILQHYWNFPDFISPQKEVIESVLQKKDTLVVLPTGGGKSICYQLPALMLEGLTLVISPLIALMKDQVRQLKERGIRADLISNELSFDDVNRIMDNCKYGEMKLLYVSPERLQNIVFLERISELEVSLIAVDEAHCISEWGHDFRPSYLKIHELRLYFPSTPIMALSASVTKNIESEIIDKLGLKEVVRFKKSLKRSNLVYSVQSSFDKKSDLPYYLKKHPGSSILFVRSRRLTFELASYLNEKGMDADYFHAKLSPIEKENKQREWMQSDTRIMVSTNAFGMGIDKANVKSVLHIDLPSSIEAYFQEVGRAGRDGEKADAILLYHPNDAVKSEEIFKSNLPSRDEFYEIGSKLYSYLQIAEGELSETIYSINLPLFAEKFNFKIKKVLKVVEFLNNKEVLQIQNLSRNSLVQVLVAPKALQNVDYVIEAAEYLGRNHPGIFTEHKEVNEYVMAKELDYSLPKVRTALQFLKKEGVISYLDRNVTQILFLIPRETAYFKNVLWKAFERLQLIHWKRLQAMIYFASQREHCREKLLLSYFDEKTVNCGLCDVCLSKKSKVQSDLETKELVQLLSEKPKTLTEILNYFISVPKEEILSSLESLLEEQIIKSVGLDSYKKM